MTALHGSPRATGEAYDAIADAYTDIARDYLAGVPLDRAFLAAFAELCRTTGVGRVVDVGCGPGFGTAHLQGLGLDVLGVDVSPALLGIARATHPHLHFGLASMHALPLRDAAVSGISAWYSIIHTTPDEMPDHLREFHRVLSPGGHLVLAFFESDGGPTAPFDHRVVTAYRWSIDELADLARGAGFLEIGRLLREPLEGGRFRRGHLLLRRSASAPPESVVRGE